VLNAKKWDATSQAHQPDGLAANGGGCDRIPLARRDDRLIELPELARRPSYDAAFWTSDSSGSNPDRSNGESRANLTSSIRARQAELWLAPGLFSCGHSARRA
jgi:hypothetical protein